jgi:hypothetical protein
LRKRCRRVITPISTLFRSEKSDLFDVLALVAYALPPLTREERAAKAKVVISTRFNTKQRVFLDFVLSHYVTQGVEELDREKLRPLLSLKYHNSITDAAADLGKSQRAEVPKSGKLCFVSSDIIGCRNRNRDIRANNIGGSIGLCSDSYRRRYDFGTGWWRCY